MVDVVNVMRHASSRLLILGWFVVIQLKPQTFGGNSISHVILMLVTAG